MHTKKALQGGGMKNSCQKNKKLTDSITKGHKEKKIIETILMKSFWKSRNLFSKRFLAAGGKSAGGFWMAKS
jgi:hypothetical protein